MVKIADLLVTIRNKYQSLEEPNFGWVSGAYHNDPTRVIRERLASQLGVVEVTDLNNDVSVGYELYESGSLVLKCAVRLSMVGPYAVLVRNTPGEPGRMLVDGPSDCEDRSEAFVAATLNESGVELLDRETLPHQCRYGCSQQRPVAYACTKPFLSTRTSCPVSSRR